MERIVYFLGDNRIGQLDEILLLLLGVDVEFLPAQGADEYGMLFQVFFLDHAGGVIFRVVENLIVEIIEIDVLVEGFPRARRETEYGAHFAADSLEKWTFEWYYGILPLLLYVSARSRRG